MKRFLGLLKFEHKQYGLFYSIFAALILVAVLIFPQGIAYFDSAVNVDETRFIVIIITAVIIFIGAIGMLVTSFNHGRVQKELWLHNSASIYTLVGAKVIYTGLALIVMEAVAFIGFFFVEELMNGTVLEYVVLAFYFTMLTVVAYGMFTVTILAFFAFNLQLARYVKKFSNVILFGTVILFFYVLGELPDMTFLHIGKIDLSGLNQYLPNLNESNYSITFLFSEVYIVSEIVWILIFAGIYIGSCKWIERVLTR